MTFRADCEGGTLENVCTGLKKNEKVIVTLVLRTILLSNNMNVLCVCLCMKKYSKVKSLFYYFIHVHTDVIDDSSILTHRYSQHKLSELCSIAKKNRDYTFSSMPIARVS